MPRSLSRFRRQSVLATLFILSLFLIIGLVSAPATADTPNPTTAEVDAELRQQAHAHRIPEVLLDALALV